MYIGLYKQMQNKTSVWHLYWSRFGSTWSIYVGIYVGLFYRDQYIHVKETYICTWSIYVATPYVHRSVWHLHLYWSRFGSTWSTYVGLFYMYVLVSFRRHMGRLSVGCLSGVFVGLFYISIGLFSAAHGTTFCGLSLRYLYWSLLHMCRSLFGGTWDDFLKGVFLVYMLVSFTYV